MLTSLQACRALAAMAVAAFHLSITMMEPRYGGQGVFYEFTARGYLGVDFFFVLSGFIILFVHAGDLDQPSALATYAWRRFVRLFPIYWLYAGTFALLIYLGFGTQAKLPDSTAELLTSVTLVRFSSEVLPLPVAWSLIHELAFYTLFGLLILNLRAGLAAVALMAMTCIALFQYPSEGAELTAWQTYTAAYNLYFVFGMGAFLLYRRGGPGFVETAAGLCICVAAVVVMWQEVQYFQMLMAIGFALTLAGITKLEQTGRLRAPRWLIYIGDASYSLYLMHLGLSSVLLRFAMKLQIYPMLGPELTYLLVLAVTVALACIAYAVIERPLLGLLRHVRVPLAARKAGPRPT